jgi:hypothetical protein
MFIDSSTPPTLPPSSPIWPARLAQEPRRSLYVARRIPVVAPAPRLHLAAVRLPRRRQWQWLRVCDAHRVAVPRPEDCPRNYEHFLNPSVPPGALADVMEANRWRRLAVVRTCRRRSSVANSPSSGPNGTAASGALIPCNQFESVNPPGATIAPRTPNATGLTCAGTRRERPRRHSVVRNQDRTPRPRMPSS